MCNMEQIKNRLLEIIKEIRGKESFEYFRNSIEHYVLGTYMDSLDIVELVMRVEEEYNISIDDYNNWEDLFLDDVVKYIKNKIEV